MCVCVCVWGVMSEGWSEDVGSEMMNAYVGCMHIVSHPSYFDKLKLGTSLDYKVLCVLTNI